MYSSHRLLSMGMLEEFLQLCVEIMALSVLHKILHHGCNYQGTVAKIRSFIAC